MLLFDHCCFGNKASIYRTAGGTSPVVCAGDYVHIETNDGNTVAQIKRGTTTGSSRNIRCNQQPSQREETKEKIIRVVPPPPLIHIVRQDESFTTQNSTWFASAAFPANLDVAVRSKNEPWLANPTVQSFTIAFGSQHSYILRNGSRSPFGSVGSSSDVRKPNCGAKGSFAAVSIYAGFKFNENDNRQSRLHVQTCCLDNRNEDGFKLMCLPTCHTPEYINSLAPTEILQGKSTANRGARHVRVINTEDATAADTAVAIAAPDIALFEATDAAHPNNLLQIFELQDPAAAANAAADYAAAAERASAAYRVAAQMFTNAADKVAAYATSQRQAVDNYAAEAAFAADQAGDDAVVAFAHPQSAAFANSQSAATSTILSDAEFATYIAGAANAGVDWAAVADDYAAAADNAVVASHAAEDYVVATLDFAAAANVVADEFAAAADNLAANYATDHGDNNAAANYASDANYIAATRAHQHATTLLEDSSQAADTVTVKYFGAESAAFYSAAVAETRGDMLDVAVAATENADYASHAVNPLANLRAKHAAFVDARNTVVALIANDALSTPALVAVEEDTQAAIGHLSGNEAVVNAFYAATVDRDAVADHVETVVENAVDPTDNIAAVRDNDVRVDVMLAADNAVADVAVAADNAAVVADDIPAIISDTAVSMAAADNILPLAESSAADYVVADNVLLMEDNDAAVAVDNVMPMGENVAVGNPAVTDDGGAAVAENFASKVKRVMKKIKYALPALAVLTPIWLLGGFSDLGVDSPLGVNGC